MAHPGDGRRRVVLERLEPQVDAGRFPIKRAVGDTVDVFVQRKDEVEGTIILSREDGNPFSISSIDLDAIEVVAATAILRFTGTFQGGGTITVDHETDSTAASMETFNFSGFDNLVSLSWVNIQDIAHFDNITVVPEPGIFVAVASLGALAFCLIRRKGVR